MNKITKILSNLIDILLIIAIIIVAYKIYIKKTYGKIEDEYIDAARFIYEENGIAGGTELERIILTRHEINSMLTKPALENTCNGYVIIYPDNQGPSYEGYITCEKKYETKGFDKSFLE